MTPLPSWFFDCLSRAGKTQGSRVKSMHQDTHVALFLMGRLVAARRANVPEAFRRWLSGRVSNLGEPAVEELLLDWLNLLLSLDEQHRLLGWHLGVSLQSDALDQQSQWLTFLHIRLSVSCSQVFSLSLTPPS